MKTAILIPARYASKRFPGKPLALLTLPDGTRKSLIELSWNAAMRVQDVDECHVVTDDDRIADAADAFGASVIMTSPDCRNGTERCAEVISRGLVVAEIVVNLQGDAPLTPSWFVEDLIAAIKREPSAQVATPVLRCDEDSYRNFLDDRRAGRVGGTTVVFSAAGQALYFSKEVIPYISSDKLPDPVPVFHHVGVYAFRADVLHIYASAPEGPLEALEGLEQLRFLENDIRVLCVAVEGRGRSFWELNNPEDIPRIEAAIKHGLS